MNFIKKYLANRRLYRIAFALFAAFFVMLAFITYYGQNSGNFVMTIDDDGFKKYPKVYEYAMDMLEKEGRQAAQGLYHNLNTLESRQGSQVPFTSVNLGRDTSAEGRMVTKWISLKNEELDSNNLTIYG